MIIIIIGHVHWTLRTLFFVLSSSSASSSAFLDFHIINHIQQCHPERHMVGSLFLGIVNCRWFFVFFYVSSFHKAKIIEISHFYTLNWFKFKYIFVTKWNMEMVIASKRHSNHHCAIHILKTETLQKWEREWERECQFSKKRRATSDSSMKSIWMIMTSAFWLRQQNYKYDKRLSA